MPVILYMRGDVDHAVVVVGYSVVNGMQKVFINDPSGAFLGDKLGLPGPFIAVATDWGDVCGYTGGLSYAIPVGGPNHCLLKGL